MYSTSAEQVLQKLTNYEEIEKILIDKKCFDYINPGVFTSSTAWAICVALSACCEQRNPCTLYRCDVREAARSYNQGERYIEAVKGKLYEVRG